jgi:hypothetical protein
MSRQKKDISQQKTRRAPARTVESRENQLISDAIDLAAKQIREGSASSQVITHFLKLGSTREKLEKEKLIMENKLIAAKTESIQSEKKIEDLYLKAIKAMARYRGESDENSDTENVED